MTRGWEVEDLNLDLSNIAVAQGVHMRAAI